MSIHQTLAARLTGRLRRKLLSVERWLVRINPRMTLSAIALAGLAAHLAGLGRERSALVAGLLAYSYLVLLASRQRTIGVARQMNAALSRSESRSHAMIDTAPDAVMGVDEDGAICQCNRAAMHIFGCKAEDLIGKPLSFIVPTLTVDALEGWFAEHAIARRVIGHEIAGQRVDGTVFPIAASASETELDGERFYTFILRDMSDTKWAEQELLLRERALSSSADGIVISDMRQPHGPVIYANRAFEIMTGYDVWEILGHSCSLLQGPDTDPQAVARMSAAIRERRPCQEVLRNYRKDGTPFWNEVSIAPVVQPDGQVMHYVGVLKDITQRIASERILQQRTERLNAVFDLSPDGFVVLDEHDVVSIVNPVFEHMTGLPATELVGQSKAAFEQRLDALCTRQEWVDVLPMAGDTSEDQERSPIKGDEDTAHGPHGHELLHLHSPKPRTLLRRVRRSSGGSHETVMYVRDITHELEVDRMKSEFLSMAAHELRTPMASIFGFTELLLKRHYDDERRRDMLGTVHKQAAWLISLVNELLDLARIEARRGKDFCRKRQPLQPIVRDTVAALLVNNDGRGVIINMPDEPIWLDVDEGKLAQALTNVLSNAYKYSPAGGDITVSARGVQHQGRSGCAICVSDRGIGMSPAEVSRVFERFFRADTSGNIPGTGLGMTIVKEIVELHGGHVSVESVQGEGTSVTMWLPVFEGSTAAVGLDTEATAA